MKLTSAMANKLLKDYQRQIEELEQMEMETMKFTVASTEDVESVRPEYDYGATRLAISDLNRKIVKLKHYINQFNITTVIQGFEMTVDKALVWLPMLNREAQRLGLMANMHAKTRCSSRLTAPLIEYQYANYDIDKAKTDYENVLATIRELQLALDTVNNTIEFEVEL